MKLCVVGEMRLKMRYEGKITWEKYIAAKKEINDEIYEHIKAMDKLERELNELECECDINIREKV